ncbi:MAG: hypothetical protein NC935_02130, partial [Candidatus Omnitrophica bacterium]|nr:hypothetical protein [Candidatus Omnitrophota bacterium]
NWRIFYATSPDGLTWTKYDNSIPSNSDTTGTNGRIPLGTSGKGDSYHAYASRVIKDVDKYKMWYAGYDGTNTRSYYATSSDGLTWTKYDNSIPSNSDTTGTNGRIPLGTSGKGDSIGIYSPNIIKDGDTYKMWYVGHNGTNPRIFYATAPANRTVSFWRKSSSGEWQYITNSDGASYINGNSGFFATNYPIYATHTNMLIGKLSISNSYFNGLIDEVMIFNKSLTQAEIQAFYNNQSKRFKDEGEVILSSIQLNETGYDKIEVSLEEERKLNSRISVSIGYCSNLTLNCSLDESYIYTEKEFLDNTGKATLNIPLNTTDIKPKIKLYANTTQGNESFYTPLVYSNVSLFLTQKPEWITIPDNATIVYGESENWEGVQFEAEAKGNAEIDGFGVNDSRFIMNKTGFLKTDEKLNASEYYLLISVNDTEGNNNTLIYLVNITKREITIKADDKTKVYSTSDPPLTYTITSGSLVYNDYITGSLEREAGESAGNYSINRGSLDVNNNYNITFISGLFSITKATPLLSLISDSGWVVFETILVTISGENCPSQLECKLYLEGEELVNPYSSLFPAGNYTFEYNTTGNQNYTSYSITKTLISQKATSSETKYCKDTSFGYNYLNNQRYKPC